MSLNSAHTNNGGILLYVGELILLYSENVTLEWSKYPEKAFEGKKQGKIYLTTHRMVFINRNLSNPMKSFSFPFLSLSEIGVGQPIFAPNYVKAKVTSQQNSNWFGDANFKLKFKHGGAIDFARSLVFVSHLASRSDNNTVPASYFQPRQVAIIVVQQPTDYYDSYYGGYSNYGGWYPPTDVFPERPPAEDVHTGTAPPPYPGLTTGSQRAAPPQYPGNQPQQQPAGYHQRGYRLLDGTENSNQGGNVLPNFPRRHRRGACVIL